MSWTRPRGTRRTFEIDNHQSHLNPPHHQQPVRTGLRRRRPRINPRWVGSLLLGLVSMALCVAGIASRRSGMAVSVSTITVDPSSEQALSVAAVESLTATLTPRLDDALFKCRHAKSVHAIRTCYPAQYVRPFINQPDCNDIVDWISVQRCLMGRFHSDEDVDKRKRPEPSSRRNIREVHIVGERNSGTKFITNAIQKCFPKPNVRVHRDFLRGKHFFQPIRPSPWHEPVGDYRSSLVVVIVRDPFDWMASMLEKPYHSPAHVAGFDATTGAVQSLQWREFVAKPWAPTLNAQTLLFHNMSLEHKHTTLPCREDFTAVEVLPCRLDNVTAQQPPWRIPLSKWRGYEPIYELRRDFSGQPYDHLLQLRADKMVNWILELPLLMRLGGFLVVRYEDVLERGNEFVMRQVAGILQNQTKGESTLSIPPLSLPCTFTGPQPERRGKRSIPDDFREWIQQNLNADMEKLVGYQ